MSAPLDDVPGVDSEHPWIGLASFTEVSQGYFHGRDAEIMELCRRIQRKPLTVLFGKSGLGKTSILQAGVVPSLRDQGYCPVYLRIDYAAGAPSAAGQIKRAIIKSAELSGRWSRQGVASEGESLWAFLHHRDDVLLDADGRPLLPLLIFDQFEEIFTLAQADEQGRERAAAFKADLADLVENRPPAELEALLEQDDSAYERYDLARADYRVVISLREDYLAHLEGLKAAMPSITQNRLRLAPMTGAQALSAIVQPGRHLVNDEVAAAIVRFVAGGAELAHAEVEPSLLSLICRELNDQRIALGRPEIGADLLAGSHASILGEFYERSVADQPAGVRNFIEDHLLTDSGYRENVAEERVRSEFATAGALPEALALLVNRRLLRIEERLDLRRVELTHDVLCAVVRASRDARREREALEASERLIVVQAERAHLAQRALQRARGIAAVCILLAVGAAAASGFAIVSSRRAQQAEHNAQTTRMRAEKLLSYLQQDFSRQIVPLGRLDLVQGLDDRVVGYFDAVPNDQRTPAWAHSHAAALLAQASTRVDQGHLAEATVPLNSALDLFESRYLDGHRSEVDLAELADALSNKALWQIYGSSNFDVTLPLLDRAAKLLKEATKSGLGSEATRIIQAGNSESYCYIESTGGVRPQDAVASCERARAQYSTLGALDLRDPIVGAEYLWTSHALMYSLNRQGGADEALPIGESSLMLGRRFLAKWPAYTYGVQSVSYIDRDMAALHAGRLEFDKAAAFSQAAETIVSPLVKSDPTSSALWTDLGGIRAEQAKAAWDRGDPARSSQRLLASLDAYASAPPAAFGMARALTVATLLVDEDAERGDQAALKSSLARRAGLSNAMLGVSPAPSPQELVAARCSDAAISAELALMRDDAVASATAARVAVAKLDDSSHDPAASRFEQACRYQLTFVLGRALFRANEMAAAEDALQASIAAHAALPGRTAEDARAAARLSTWLALAQIRQGRLAQGSATLAPVLALQRGLFDRSGGASAQQRLELAMALYADALTEEAPARRSTLARAAALVDGLPAPVRALHSVKLWTTWIAAARGSRAAPSSTAIVPSS